MCVNSLLHQLMETSIVCEPVSYVWQVFSAHMTITVVHMSKCIRSRNLTEGTESSICFTKCADIVWPSAQIFLLFLVYIQRDPWAKPTHFHTSNTSAPVLCQFQTVLYAIISQASPHPPPPTYACKSFVFESDSQINSTLNCPAKVQFKPNYRLSSILKCK